MGRIKKETLAGWGNTPAAECECYRPEKQRELRGILQSHKGALLARGMGRSYGDAALQPQGIIRSERLDHLMEFDLGKGIVRAQAGLTLADLMEIIVPRGWFPPVIPGTRSVTLGGAFASNVHGKNHWRDGDFAEHVLSVRLMLGSGETIECSPSEHSELFWATAGGMGMTGIIEEITLKLRPIASASLMTTSYRVHSLNDMVAAFEQNKNSADYMVGWIDHMVKGNDIGRGIFEAANHLTAGEGEKLTDFKPLKTRISVPCYMPANLLNRYSMALYNKWRFKKQGDQRRSERVGFDGFFHPLDNIGHWNRLYGKRGFFQYQCLIPEGRDTVYQMRKLLSGIHHRELFSFLAVIKYHRAGQGMLAFSQPGYSIALDFANVAHVRDLIPQLNDWVAELGGKVYLAKDALLTADTFDKMYSRSSEWRGILHDVDPSARFTSLMSDRLHWKTYA